MKGHLGRNCLLYKAVTSHPILSTSFILVYLFFPVDLLLRYKHQAY